MYEHVGDSFRIAINTNRVSYVEHWNGQNTITLTFDNDQNYTLVCNDEAAALREYVEIKRIMDAG